MADEKDDEFQDNSGYKVASRKSVSEILKTDGDDESLNKMKKELLGDGKGNIFDEKDPRTILFDSFILEPTGENHVKLDPNTLSKDNDSAFTLKENGEFRLRIKFRVQREIVLGLKKQMKVYRKGVRVSSEQVTMGSFAPGKEHDFAFDLEDAPGGFLARGTYTAQVIFIDDDKNNHLQFDYKFKIGKAWG